MSYLKYERSGNFHEIIRITKEIFTEEALEKFDFKLTVEGCPAEINVEKSEELKKIYVAKRAWKLSKTKLAAVKALRSNCGVALKEAKDFVESHPEICEE